MTERSESRRDASQYLSVCKTLDAPMEGERKERTNSRLRRTLVWFAIGATVGVLVPVSISLVSQPRVTVENTTIAYLGSCSFAVRFDLWKHDNDELAVVYQIFVSDVPMLSPPRVSYMEAQGFWPFNHTVSSSTSCSAEATVSVRILETYPYVD